MNELKEQHHLDLIWDAYKNNNDLKARDLLLEEYIPLVKYVAGRLALSLPHNVETGDLESFGFFGLLDAMEKYDQLRNIKFETYASTRIRGAIIDGLRSMDWVPRSTRSKARSLETQIYRLTNELGRNPEDSEIAAALDVSPERYYELLNEVRGTTLFSLDEAVTTDSQNDNLKLLDLVIDKDISHDERLLQNEIVEELSGAIEKLSEREQLVLA